MQATGALRVRLGKKAVQLRNHHTTRNPVQPNGEALEGSNWTIRRTQGQESFVHGHKDPDIQWLEVHGPLLRHAEAAGISESKLQHRHQIARKLFVRVGHRAERRGLWA